MILPVRLRLSRRKGFNLQEHSRALNGLGAVNVARPGKWGNPYVIGMCNPDVRGRNHVMGSADCIVKAFRGYAARCIESHGVEWMEQLHGNNLACWCGLCDAHAFGKPAGIVCAECKPCHADVLLELANSP